MQHYLPKKTKINIFTKSAVIVILHDSRISCSFFLSFWLFLPFSIRLKTNIYLFPPNDWYDHFSNRIHFINPSSPLGLSAKTIIASTHTYAIPPFALSTRVYSLGIPCLFFCTKSRDLSHVYEYSCFFYILYGWCGWVCMILSFVINSLPGTALSPWASCKMLHSDWLRYDHHHRGWRNKKKSVELRVFANTHKPSLYPEFRFGEMLIWIRCSSNSFLGERPPLSQIDFGEKRRTVCDFCSLCNLTYIYRWDKCIIFNQKVFFPWFRVEFVLCDF